ncbi:hypothetical protein ACFE04_026766 [Oxalis oulophora]
MAWNRILASFGHGISLTDTAIRHPSEVSRTMNWFDCTGLSHQECAFGDLRNIFDSRRGGGHEGHASTTFHPNCWSSPLPPRYLLGAISLMLRDGLPRCDVIRPSSVAPWYPPFVVLESSFFATSMPA